MSSTRTVLVLHGYSQSATIFSKRLGALRKECGNSVELVFIDAPHVLHPIDLGGLSSPSQSAAETLASLESSEAAEANLDPSLTPRAWWKANADRTAAFGLSESLENIRDVLRTRRFDGVLGFSQGAALAALTSALLERPHLYPPFFVDGKPPHPPFQFCIAVSGFLPRDPIADPLFTPSYSTPTLHIIGKTDIIVTEERSRRLAEVSSNRRVEEHDGGHFVPSKGQWRKFLRDYMKDPFADLLSPGIVNSSVPNSGTATPTGSNNDSVLMMKL